MKNQFCLKMFGCRPLDYLEQVGWLNDRTWLAHAIHYTDEELVRLGRRRVGMALSIFQYDFIFRDVSWCCSGACWL